MEGGTAYHGQRQGQYYIFYCLRSGAQNCFCLAYRSKFGPTEYVFAQLCNGVRHCVDRIRTVEDLIAAVYVKTRMTETRMKY